MVNLLVGLVSSLLLVSLYSVLERKRVSNIGQTKYLFIGFVVLSAYIFQPTHALAYWLMWMFMFYTVLDDLKTQTVFTPIYIVVVIGLFLKGHALEEFLFAVLMFVIFLLFSRKTKETFFSVGDCFIIFVLAFWMGKLMLVALLLASILAGVILPIVSAFMERSRYYPFSIFLVGAAIMIQCDWHVGSTLIVGFLLNLLFVVVIGLVFIGIKITQFKKKKLNSKRI